MKPLAILSMFFLMSFATRAGAADENVLTIESWGNKALELNLSAPQGYSVQKEKGPDFNVHYITSKDPNDPTMGLYIGHHPNLFSSQRQGIEIRKGKDVILGQSLEWISWQEKQNGKTIYKYETIISNVFKGVGGAGVEGLLIHIFIHGSDKKKVDRLKTCAKPLRKVVKE